MPLAHPVNEASTTIATGTSYTRGTDVNIVLTDHTDFPNSEQGIRISDGAHFALLIYTSKTAGTPGKVTLPNPTSYALARNVSPGSETHTFPAGSLVELVALADMSVQLMDDHATHIANAAAHHPVHVKTLADHPESIIDPAIARDVEVDAKISTHAGNASAHHPVHVKTLADHPESIIDPAIARDVEVDAKISTHAGNASAHHAKTGHNEVFGLVAAGLTANRPAAGIAGRVFYATDTDRLFRDTGTTWETVAVIKLAELAERSHASLTGISSGQHHPRAHNHSLAADGAPIAVAGVPNLPASKITSGRFGMPRMPAGTLGQVLTARGAGANPIYAAVAGGPTIVRKTANERVIASVSPQNDDHLFFAVGAGEVWTFDVFLEIQSATDADFKWRFSLPSGGSSVITFGSDLISGVACASTIMSTGTSGHRQIVQFRIRYTGGAAGNIRLQWAQQSLRSSSTWVYANSYILAHKLS